MHNNSLWLYLQIIMYSWPEGSFHEKIRLTSGSRRYLKALVPEDCKPSLLQVTSHFHVYYLPITTSPCWVLFHLHHSNLLSIAFCLLKNFKCKNYPCLFTFNLNVQKQISSCCHIHISSSTPSHPRFLLENGKPQHSSLLKASSGSDHHTSLCEFSVTIETIM